jgi:hypothetical protein
VPGENLGKLAPQHGVRSHAVLPRRSGVEKSDAVFGIDGDHGVADLPEDLAAEAA